MQFGDLTLPNRIIMAPMTRCRASAERVPNALMAEYYVQRAGAGLIISEGCSVTPLGVGYPDTPGIWNDEQIAGWQAITDAVHKAGGLIFLQLWHVGRVSDPIYLDGQLPVAPSAIAPEGHINLIRPKKNYVTPRALETDEIPGIVAAYRQGAANAKLAGFDGVDIHGANGYLIDQFLQDCSNKRTDAYGGSIENRARLMLEVTDACIEVWGPGRVGMHISPRCDAPGMGSDSNPAATFGYVAKELGKRRIAFIFAREMQGPGLLGPQLKQAFGGVFIANEKLTGETAAQALENYADAISFGVPFIANPDLVKRLAQGAPLNPPRFELFFGGGADGYIDYPFLP